MSKLVGHPETAVLQLRSSGEGFFGAENVVLEIAKGLRRTRYRPIIGLLANNTHTSVELARHAEAHGIESVIFNCNRQVDFSTIAAIKRFVNRNGVGILHPHGYKADVYTLAASSRLSVKRVATCHPWTARYSRRARFYAWLDQSLLPRFDHVVAVCQEIKDEILQKRMRAEAVSVIENGIDVERFAIDRTRQELCRELDLPADRFLIGTVGRMVREKGHHLLIEAAASLREAYPNAFYVIAGDGELFPSMEKMIAELGLSDRFRFLGVCNRVPELLAALDVFILPSVSEGLPMVILEAMAARRPIIATGVGAIPQVLTDGECGLVVSPSSSSLAAAMSRLTRDPDLRERLAHKAYERVRDQYSSERMAQKYVDIFDRVRCGYGK
jgi:glycosyltransferase involved in cell wall biosynthesis